MAVENGRIPDFFDMNGVIAYVVKRPKLEGWTGDESNGFPADRKCLPPKLRPKEIPLSELPRT